MEDGTSGGASLGPAKQVKTTMGLNAYVAINSIFNSMLSSVISCASNSAFGFAFGPESNSVFKVLTLSFVFSTLESSTLGLQPIEVHARIYVQVHGQFRA